LNLEKYENQLNIKKPQMFKVQTSWNIEGATMIYGHHLQVFKTQCKKTWKQNPLVISFGEGKFVKWSTLIDGHKLMIPLSPKML